MTTRAQKRRRNAGRLSAILGVAGATAIAVIGYIAFTVNSGLPFESRYRVKVDIPDANRIIKDAEVRIGGINVGRVQDVAAVRRSDRRPYAQLELSLKSSAGPLPTDTRARVRPASTLGLTYIELRPGSSKQTVPDGGVLPIRQARHTVDLDDLFEVFEARTAASFRRGMTDLTTGLAGRGTALNHTIGTTRRLLAPLTQVMQVLADDRTRLGRFIVAFDSTVSALAQVSPELDGVVTNGATTAAALADAREAIGDTIDAAPGAEEAATRALTRVRPALDGLAELTTDLLPGARGLPQTLRAVNATLPAAEQPFALLPEFSGRLRTTLDDIGTVVRHPATNGAVRKATDLLGPTTGFLRALAAAEVNCNLLPLWAENFGGYPRVFGTGAGPAIANIGLTHLGAENESRQNKEPSRDAAINYLPHVNSRECESGNEPYDGRQLLTNPPGFQSKQVPDTDPPPDARARAEAAGLLKNPEGAP